MNIISMSDCTWAIIGSADIAMDAHCTIKCDKTVIRYFILMGGINLFFFFFFFDKVYLLRFVNSGEVIFT